MSAYTSAAAQPSAAGVVATRTRRAAAACPQPASPFLPQSRSVMPLPRNHSQAVPTAARRAPLQRLNAAKDGKQQQATELKRQGSQEDPTPFFEPLLRSLLLGFLAGAAVETVHTFSQVGDLAQHVGINQLAGSLPSFIQQFSPLFFWDHVAAVGAWMIFYVIEAVAVLSILNMYPDPNNTEAISKIKGLPTLPKRIMPLKLQFAKALLRKADNFATSAASGFSGSSGSSGASVNSRYIKKNAPASPPPTPLPAVNAALATIEPSVVTPPPAPAAPAGPAPLPLDQPVQRALTKAELSKANHKEVSKVVNRNVDVPERKPAALQSVEDLEKIFKRKPATKPGEKKVSKRDQELADRKAYLKNFWYVAAISENVKDKPVGVDMLGRRIVLFRDSQGKVHCLDDACPHRGAPLSGGWVENARGHDCVVCPYHGWAFDEEGRLQDVPSMPAGSNNWPHRPLVDSYPVEEKGGFIWLFYGSKSLPEEERPPIPTCDELEDPAWRPVYGEIEFDMSHFSVFENAIDMAHIHYLHGGSFGNSEKPEIMDMTIAKDAYGVESTFRIYNKPVNAFWNWTAVPSVPVVARAMLPSTSYVKIQLGAGVSMITFVNTVPIDENRAVNRFCLIRNFALSPAFDGYTRNSMYKILGEDKVMLEQLHPERVESEISVRADLPQIAFRNLRQEYINMGYGVPPEVEAKRRSKPRPSSS